MVVLDASIQVGCCGCCGCGCCGCCGGGLDEMRSLCRQSITILLACVPADLESDSRIFVVVVIGGPPRFWRDARAFCCSGPEDGDCGPELPVTWRFDGVSMFF